MQSKDGNGLADGPLRSRVHVGEGPIEPAALVREVSDPAAGATVLFMGTVRDHSEGKPDVSHLEYEAYGEYVEQKIADVVAEAARRWPLLAAVAVHRTGRLEVGEISVAVAVSAGHRDEAFSGGRFIIDELKATAPIWKKEHWAGGAEWVREDRAHP